MWVWILMLLSIVGLWFLIPDGIGKKKKNLIFLSVSFIIVVFVMGSRSPHFYEVADLYNYYDRYMDVINYPIEWVVDYSRMDTGYLYFTKFIGWWVPWGQFIIYFEAALTTGVFFWYIYRNAENVYLATVIYIVMGPWQFFLTGFRQAFAIAFCFIALELIKKRKLRWDLVALGLIIFSASLHSMAWIFLVVFVMRYMKLSKGVVILSLLIFVALIVFAKPLIESFNLAQEAGYTETYSGSFFGGLIPIAFYSFALGLSFFVWRRDKEVFDNKNKLEIFMLIFGLVVYISRYNARVMERVSYFFTPVIVIVMTNAIMKQESKRLKTVLEYSVIALCLGLYIYRVIVQFSDYHFYWEYYEYLATI